MNMTTVLALKDLFFKLQVNEEKMLLPHKIDGSRNKMFMQVLID
jgi:hypothetical protein